MNDEVRTANSHPAMNTIMRVSLIGLPFALVGLVYFGVAVNRSSWETQVGRPIEQPVQFTHEHHVQGLGIDCRYCHSSVERSAFADIPPTETCMSCHSQVWTEAPILEPVRESWRTGMPIHWRRVYDLPDFVYFNHSAHVQNGIGCVTCHGRVDEMPLLWKAEPLFMQWCVDCHRDPTPHLRPLEHITDMTWQPEGDGLEMGRALMRKYGIETQNLTDCTRCHR